MTKTSRKKPIARFLADIVKRAADIITEEFTILAKNEYGDLVTNFDVEVEEFIIGELKKYYPDYTIVSEETHEEALLTENCFVIDPIDGTGNFCRNIPLWGIQAAAIENGETVAAAIYLPKLGELYHADKNGAYLNGKKIRVAKTDIKKSIYDIEAFYKVPSYERMLKFSRHMRNTCCSAVNYSWIAAGRMDGTILRKDYVWDYMPGQFIVKQAGGTILNVPGGHIAACNKKLANLLLENARLIENDCI